MNISLKPLQNQVVVVTGASSGIGLVTARMAAIKGAKLVVAARNEEALSQLVDEIRAAIRQSMSLLMSGKKKRLTTLPRGRSPNLEASTPEAVAEAILYAAAHQKRDMFVGSQAKFLAILGGLAPRLTDKLMEVWAFPSQQADREKGDREDNALYRAGYGLQERGTHQGWIRSGSLYVKASEYPVLTTITIAGIILVLWSLASSTTLS